MKHTKIITTLGPAVKTKEDARRLLEAGSNVCRFNFSHGDHEQQGAKMQMIREVSKETGTPWSLLLDTKGPEIRTHSFKGGEVEVVKGSTVTVNTNEIVGSATEFSVSYPNLHNDIKVGGSILVDDGYLELKIKSIEGTKIICEAMNTHKIADRRGINVPGITLNIPFMSEKDRADYEFGCDQNVHYMALSFVQRAADIKEVRAILEAKGKSKIKLIAKLENQGACDNFDEILAEADGIMVARGDLGVEVPAWEVPVYQKEWVSKANAAGKIAIVATQMLESMISNPRPTRAEVSDVYNAVLDGADATMLSGESAKGIYGTEATIYMAKIDERAEKEFDYDNYVAKIKATGNTPLDKVAQDLVSKVNNSSINHAIIFDEDGKLTEVISKYKPHCKLLPITSSEDLAYSFGAYYGVYATQVPNFATFHHDEKKLGSVATKFGAAKGAAMLIVDKNGIKEVRVK